MAVPVDAPARPQCHFCRQPAAYQWQRQANATERALRHTEIQAMVGRLLDEEYILDRYGPPRAAVYGCEQHELSPAPADDAPEAVTAARQAGTELRAITHKVDCGGHGKCACAAAPAADTAQKVSAP
jgi:hypothetical protein